MISTPHFQPEGCEFESPWEQKVEGSKGGLKKEKTTP